MNLTTTTTIALIFVLILAILTLETESFSTNSFGAQWRSSKNITAPKRMSYKIHNKFTRIKRYSDTEYFIDVENYGAVGDGVTDNTDAFQAALNYAQSIGGAKVYAPAGYFVFKGKFTIPSSVSLEGTYTTVPSHDLYTPNDGTILMPYYGRNNDSYMDSFITISEDASLRGVVIYYPEQVCSDTIPPVSYPPTIYMNGNNAAIEDVELLNSWIGIWAVEAHRHYIARIQGQPIMIGVYIDETYDIGRIEDVHFNPWFCNNANFMYTQTTYGRAFVMGRSDWEYVFNTFAFAYAIGYDFVNTSTGAMNGNFLGLGADLACNASVRVGASQDPGLLITNGEFTSFLSSDFAPYTTAVPTQVIVEASNKGAVLFEGTSFWGPTDSIARLYGKGIVTFSNCIFVQWDEAYHRGSPAIYAQGGNLILTNNQFLQEGLQLNLESGVKKATIMGNILTGPINFQINDTIRYALYGNVGDS